MDLVNDTTLINVFNILGGIGTVVSVSYIAFLISTHCCCKRKRCVCRVQLCEPIDDAPTPQPQPEQEPVPGPGADKVNVPEVQVQVQGQGQGQGSELHAPAGLGEVVRKPVQSQPQPLESETITLIQAPPRPRFF
jgi:hypothetical protein